MTGSLTNNLLGHLHEPPQRHVLTDEVYDGLKTLIMNQVLEPGSRLTIDVLARELGTSSTPIREALARLEGDGLAVKVALRGYLTAPLLTAHELDELTQLRLLLEPWAARRAAETLDQAGKASLDAEMSFSPEPPASSSYEAYQDFSAHDNRLHDLIHQLADNETVRRAWTRANVHVHIFRLGYTRTIALPSTHEHQAIIDAIKARDPDAADTAMRTHLHCARDRLKKLVWNATPDETPADVALRHCGPFGES